MTGHRRDSLTLGDDASIANPHHTAYTRSSSPPQLARQQSRSASPAKRTASEMEDGNASDMDQQMNMNRPTSPTSHPAAGNDLNGGQKEHTDAPATFVDMAGSNHASYVTSADASPKSSHSGALHSPSSNTTTGSSASADRIMQDAVPPPPLNDQVKMIVEKVMMTTMQDKQVGYVVANTWIQRVMARCEAGNEYGPFDKEALEGEIGPVDNTTLLPAGVLDQSLRDDHGELFVPLDPAARFGDDFYVLPEDAYNLIVRWYGAVKAQPVITRYAHDTTPDGTERNVQWETHPPIFTIRKLRSDDGFSKNAAQDATRRAPRIVASRNSTFQSFLARVKVAVDVPKTTKVRLWRVLKVQSTSTESERKSASTLMLSPPASRDPSPESRPPHLPLLMDAKSFGELADKVDRERIDIKDETNNEKYNGSLQLGTAGLAEDQVIIVDEQGSGDDFSSDVVRRLSNKNGLSLTKKGSALLSQNSSGRSSPTRTGGIMTRGRNRAQGKSKGTVGLTNLGNTCYMNSALQCIRATEELSAYFLEGQWRRELNADNPLGHNGQIAKTYAGFLDAVYQPGQGSFAPRNFKSVLGRCGPQFSGYGQQDSQEFMSFLVDALHEDLNRIHKKPYTENPDSDDNIVDDPEAVKALGEVFRKNYRARNDSVVMDLFNGFYKNTMVCPDCDKVSITFDPYSLLTLQLPIEHSWLGQITFFPLFGKPMTIEIDMDKHSSIKALKQFVASRLPGTDASRMMFAEVFSHKFFRTVEDSQTIMELGITARDDMVLYELDDVASNFPPQKKKPKKVRSMLVVQSSSDDDDSADEKALLSQRLMVPVFHRAPTNSYNSVKSLALTPTFIILTPKEARNYDEVYRKVLGQAANLTTRDIFAETENGLESSRESVAEADVDAVITMEEDACSTAEPRIQARSVEGEDGIIDITMTEDKPAETDGVVRPNMPKAIPSVMGPGSRIPDSLRDLFELRFISPGTDMIPTGWSTVDAARNYPMLLSRVPEPPRKMSMLSSESPPSTISSESSDADEITAAEPSTVPSFTNGGESDEEELFSAKPSSSRNRKAGKNGKKGKHSKHSKKLQHNYSQKGQKQLQRGQNGASGRHASESSDASAETKLDGNQALIRLGEAIIVDWNKDAYFGLFGGDKADDMAGEEISRDQQQKLVDPELEAKQQRRKKRRADGVSLDECFAETAKGEILTEENAWYCGRCKELRRASKKLEIWTAPDILVIHLKRFSANRQFRDKIDVLVDFPIEGLDLTGKVGLTEGKDMTYDLFAVDNHYGGLGGGHYTAFAKNFVDERWYEYNDSSVCPRNASSVITTASYLLFYRRRSARPLGPPSLQKIVHEFRNPSGEVDNDSDGSSSRNASPSGQGKGQCLDGLSLNQYNGSSSASVEAELGHQLRGGDGLVATKARDLTMLDEGYGEGDADDEGVSTTAIFGPQLPHQEAIPTYGENSTAFITSATAPSWQWTTVNTAPSNEEEVQGGDLASDIAADGDDEDGGFEDRRLLEDFGDEIHEGLNGFGTDSILQNSPALPALGDDEYHEDVIPDMLDRDEIYDDSPVAEVRVEGDGDLDRQEHEQFPKSDSTRPER